MLRVPSRRQADDTACLPTCVEAVLAFLGRDIAPDQIRAWCGTTTLGSDVDLAEQGLNDAAIDAELVRCDTLEELGELLEAGRPPIAVLAEGDGWSHSVVVCEIDEGCVTIMDPRTGNHSGIARADFLAAWQSLAGETLLVSGRPVH